MSKLSRKKRKQRNIAGLYSYLAKNQRLAIKEYINKSYLYTSYFQKISENDFFDLISKSDGVWDNDYVIEDIKRYLFHAEILKSDFIKGEFGIHGVVVFHKPFDKNSLIFIKEILFYSQF